MNWVKVVTGWDKWTIEDINKSPMTYVEKLDFSQLNSEVSLQVIEAVIWNNVWEWVNKCEDTDFNEEKEMAHSKYNELLKSWEKIVDQFGELNEKTGVGVSDNQCLK